LVLVAVSKGGGDMDCCAIGMMQQRMRAGWIAGAWTLQDCLGKR
jgi:hypothetical protein